MTNVDSNIQNNVEAADNAFSPKRHKTKDLSIQEIDKLEEFAILAERLAEDCKCMRQVQGNEEDCMYESVLYTLSHCPLYIQEFGNLTTEKLRRLVAAYILENSSNPCYNAYIGQTIESRERYCDEILNHKKWGNIEVDLVALSMILKTRIFVHKLDYFTNEYSVQMLGYEDFPTQVSITFQAKARRFNVVEDIKL